jgi:DNA polymerase III epsilon subunit-like protein
VTAPTMTETDKLPVYERKEVPDHLQHLCTMTQLKEQRLKPADGQQPVALLRVYRRGHGWGEFPLYDPAGAAEMRPLSAKQQAAKTARRTCPKCGEVRDHVVHRMCSECAERERKASLDLQRRTCVWCRRVSLAPHPQGVSSAPHPTSENLKGRRGECVPCWLHRTIRRQAEAERTAVWRRTCPGRDCQMVTATDEEIAAERAAGTWYSPRWCPPCAERDALERAERQRAAEEARERAVEERRQEVADLEEWARTVLADPDTVILDTETTGLHDEARIVDIAITTVAGSVLLDALVDPGEPIPAEATDIHGITDDQVTGAPTLSDLLVKLTSVLDGKRCLIYNKPYHVGRLRHELTEHYRKAGHEDPGGSASAWLDCVRFEDVMIPYSTWVGDWSDYWGNYSWQPLYGGDHRAVSDCRAVVERLREMTGTARDGDTA